MSRTLKVASVWFSTLASRASSCPFCDGGPDGVNEVRAAIFDAGFFPTFASVVLPVVVVCMLAAAVHNGWACGAKEVSP